MNEFECRIRLQHDLAQSFFNDALHPNMDELRRRDSAIAELDKVHPFRNEGTDLVAEIPDIDIEALLDGANIFYRYRVDLQVNTSYVSMFTVGPMVDVAA